MDSSLHERTFGSESPPYDNPKPLLTWEWGLSEEEIQDLQASVVQEFRRRYEKNGLSDLISMREYLSSEKNRLRRSANECWSEVSHLQKKISGGKSTDEPSEREREKFDTNVSKAGDMNRKADVVEYRLYILKSVIWKISVNGEISNVRTVEKSERKRSKFLWDKTRAIILSIHEDEGLKNISAKTGMYHRIMIRETDEERGESAVRKYLERNLDGGLPDDPEGMIEHVEKWRQEEDVRKLAQRYGV